MKNTGDLVNNKIFTEIDLLVKKINSWRLLSNTIVFTNGCFDLMHAGHIHLLTSAKNLGDKLIVGVNSDNSVKKIKGPTRPINDEQMRLKLLASLFYVDAVILFNEETPYELIKAAEPDILVKGGDYIPEKIVGADMVLSRGGKVEIINYIEGLSSSATEQKIKQLHKL